MCFRYTLSFLAALSLLLPAASSAAESNRIPAQQRLGKQADFERLFGTTLREFRRPAPVSSPSVILVTNTNDAGPGSFRQAIIEANAHFGADSIAFNIPTTDPGYDHLKGVWTIKPLTQFPPLIEDGTVIEGHSQKLFSPGSNPSGPAVELDGSLMAPIDICLLISCSWTFVHELTINRFETGIVIAGVNHSFNLIYQCYIGVTPDGRSKAPNVNSGILITSASLNFISWPDTAFTSFANVIGGNGGAGIEIRGTASTLNYVGPNCIGTDLSRTADLGNAGDGILINDGASDNAIMNFDAPEYIVIRNNGQAGIHVSGGETLRNLLAAGSITNNGGPGILLEKGGNSLMAFPIITSAVDNAITATATPLSLVAFYRDPEDEGEEYIGQAYADAAGTVTYYGPLQGPYLTAIAIDTTTGGSKNNTSAFSQPFSYQSEILVTNTSDDGPGSYRAAIIKANSHPGPDIIRFAIPQSDRGFNAQPGIWTIKPTTLIPAVMDRQTTINGSSQAEFIGYDVNPYGPEIELDGSLLDAASGVFLNRYANGSVIEGLVINRFGNTGITINGTDTAYVVGCYIGTDATGLQKAPNPYGIVLEDHARNVTIQSDQAGVGNLISGNIHHGIQVSDSCSINHIVGNTIGLDRTRTRTLGNGGAGVDVNMGSDGTEIANNWVGGNGRGIDILTGCYSNVVMGNFIGTDTASQTNLGNTEMGILVSESRATLIQDNRIAYNGQNAVIISGASALSNRISRNRICHHGPPAILNYAGGNTEYRCPTITGLNAGVLSGTAQPNAHIEVFSDSTDEGEFFLGHTFADAAGNWSLNQMAAPRARCITATAMDANGNTSGFSAPFDHIAAGVPEVEQGLPTRFALEQNYPNPFNPTTRIQYTVGGAGETGAGVSGLGTSNTKIVVYDLLGRQVAVLVDEKKAPGSYVVTFSAKGGSPPDCRRAGASGGDGGQLASGMYIYRLTAGTFVQSRTMLLIK
jgi:hypothetical protein